MSKLIANDWKWYFIFKQNSKRATIWDACVFFYKQEKGREREIKSNSNRVLLFVSIQNVMKKKRPRNYVVRIHCQSSLDHILTVSVFEVQYKREQRPIMLFIVHPQFFNAFYDPNSGSLNICTDVCVQCIGCDQSSNIFGVQMCYLSHKFCVARNWQITKMLLYLSTSRNWIVIMLVVSIQFTDHWIGWRYDVLHIILVWPFF